MLNLTQLKKLFREAFSDFNRHETPTLGAALAYYTVLSLAPLLIIAVSIAGMVYGKKAATGELVYQFRDLAGPSGAQVIQGVLASAASPAQGTIASLIGFATLIFGASGVFKALRDSLNRVWEVRTPAGTGIWSIIRSEFSTFWMVLGIGFLLLVSLVVSALLSGLSKIVARYVPVTLLQSSNMVISLVVITFLFALIFRFVPSTRIAWNDVWIGAVVTGLLFTIGKFLIGLYLGKASVGSAYGAAGSLVALLVWVYYSAQIMLFGAEFTHVYAKARGSRKRGL